MTDRKIHTARKAGKCQWGCGGRIEVGDRYIDGDVDPYKAGGFAHDRVCMACAPGYLKLLA